ncbi:MAG: DUF1549 domain-containing protein [Roseimicrobium sp.]
MTTTNRLHYYTRRSALAAAVLLALACQSPAAVEATAPKTEAAASKAVVPKNQAKAAAKKAERKILVSNLTPPPSISPKSTAKPDLKASAAKIDELVSAKLAKENIAPHAPISDEVFLRRVYLDVIGRVPTMKEALAFLDSNEPAKRSKLIDKLLNSDGYVQHYFNFWADVLRIKSGILPGGQGRDGGAAYILWLKNTLRANKPYDQMVRELLTADGATYQDGAIGYYLRDYNMELDNMAITTQIFLGTQMVCAQCHNHPFDKWTQMDYYQMAAHTSGMTGTNNLANQADVERFMSQQGLRGEERKNVTRAFSEILFRLRFNHIYALDKTLKLPQDYQYPDAKPNTRIEPVIPAAFSKDGKIVKEGQAPVLAYAQWMTSKDNPRFTTVVANRLWKKLFGMGVIDPVDELTDSTVPSNPQLMEFIEKTMKDADYDMKAYLRILLNTQSYQRSSHTEDVELGAQYHFPGPLLRRMTAEQIWDSFVAMVKESPDEASHQTHLETIQGLTRIEWMDRTVQALSPQELVDGAKQVAAYKDVLTAEVQAKTKALKDSKDEKAIRDAKAVAKTQRTKIYAKADEIVFNDGFKKFAERVSQDPSALAKATDRDFAEQVLSAVKHYGRVPTMDEALSYVLKSQKEGVAAVLAARRDHEMKAWGVKDSQKDSFKAFVQFRDANVMRASDMRNPAPNGHFLRQYGQSDREIVENSSRDASVMQALTMMNGSLFRNLVSPFSVISRAVRTSSNDDEAIDAIYLSTLTRHATDEEKALLRGVVAPGVEGKGDALWTVLNTRQFLFIP